MSTRKPRADPELTMPGSLVLVATPIGNLSDLAPRAIEALTNADWIAAEHPETTRALMSWAGIVGGDRLRRVHQHNEREQAPWIVEQVAAGKMVVYVTDAGMPAISDPGAVLVRATLDAGLPVQAVTGPSAFLHALAVSGLPTDRFAFEGFLPRKGPDRRARLAAIAGADSTVVVYESPRRVKETLADLAASCGEDRQCAVARELTKFFEEVQRGSLGEMGRRELMAKGEYVIVIAGEPATRAETDDVTIRLAVQRSLAEGLTARDAAAAVSGDLGVAKRRVYELAIRIDPTK